MAEKIGELEVETKCDTSKVESSLQNFTSKMQSGMQSIGSGFKMAGTAITGAVTVPLLAIGAVAVESAMTIGKAYRIIQQRTGETGADLDKLKGSFDTLYGKLPESSDVIAEALSNVNKVLDLNGPVLESVTKGMLDLARVTGEEAGPLVDKLSGAFKEWNIPADQMGGKLDFLYRLFTETQVPVTELAAEMSKMGPLLQTSGIGFNTAASMIALMKEKGLDATPIMTGLKKVIKEAADEGIPASEKLKQVFDAIKNAKTPTEAAGIAIKEFGAKAGPVLAESIRSGTLSIEGLTKAIGGMSLEEAAKSTITFGQSWEIVRHNLEEAMAPLGRTMIQIVKSFIPVLQSIIGVVSGIFNAFDMLPQPIKMAIVIVGALLAAIGPILVIIGGIISALAPVIGIFGAILGFIIPIVTGVTSIGAAIGGVAIGGTTLGAIFALLAPIIAPLLPIIIAVAAAIAVVVGTVALIVGAFALWYATSQKLRDLVGGALGYISNEFKTLSATIGEVIGLLQAGKWGAAFDTIKGYISGVVDRFKSIDWGAVWAKLVDSLRESINKIGTVIGGIRDEFMKWASTVDWKGVGSKIGDLLGKAIVAFFQGGVSILKMILDAISGNTSYAEDAGKDIGKSYGTGIQSYFKGGQFKIDLSNVISWGKETFAGISEAVGEQLARIHIDWGLLMEELAGTMVLTANLMGMVLYNAIASVLNKVLPKELQLPLIDTKDAEASLKAWLKFVSQNIPIEISPELVNKGAFNDEVRAIVSDLGKDYLKIQAKLSPTDQANIESWLKIITAQKITATVDIDPATAVIKWNELSMTLRAFKATIPVNADTKQLIAEVDSAIKVADTRVAFIGLDVKDTGYQTKLNKLITDLQTQHDLNVKAGVDNTEVDALLTVLKKPITVPVKADATHAHLALDGVTAKGTTTVTKPIDAETEKALAKNTELGKLIDTKGTKPVDADTGPAKTSVEGFAMSLGAFKFKLPNIDVSAITNTLNGVLKLISEIFTSLPGVGTAKKFVQDTLAWVGKTAKDITATGAELWASTKVIAKNAYDYIVQKGVEIKNTAVTAATNAYKWLTTTAAPWVSTALSWAKGASAGAWQWLQQSSAPWVGAAMSWAKGASAGAAQWLRESAAPWASAAMSWAQGASAGAAQWLRESAVPWASAALSWAQSASGNAANWLRQSASQWGSAALSWAQSAATDASNWLRSAASGFGSWATQTAQQAYNSAHATLDSLLGGFWSWATQTAQQAYNSAHQTLVNLLQPIINAAGAGWAALKSALGMEKGGLVMSPTLTTIAEKEPELVIPLSTIRGSERLGGLLPGSEAAGGGIGSSFVGSGNDITIDVHDNTILDDRAASQLAIKMRDALQHKVGGISL